MCGRVGEFSSPTTFYTRSPKGECTMTTKQMYLTVTVVCFIVVISLLFALVCYAEEGQITVYNEDGSVAKEYKFRYKKSTYQYVPPQDKTEKDMAPAPPSRPRIVSTAVVEEDKEDRNEVKVFRRRHGLRKKIKKIESQRVGDHQVTIIHREIKTPTGRRYKQKEIFVDASARRGSERAKDRARRNPPQTYHKIITRRVP